MLFPFENKKIWIAGHNGMVGSAIMRSLENQKCELITINRESLDLSRQDETQDWIATQKPDVIFMAAAMVGGIHANATYPAQFIHDNLAIQTNIIHAAYKNNVKKLMFLGSSCIYPKSCPQPMKEDDLLTGALEATNQPYAIAKIAGIEMCQAYRKQYGCDFISVMPTNLYGVGDNYHPQNAHVPAALIRRFHEAKQTDAKDVSIWGSGAPTRDFLCADDLADACVFLMQNYSDASPINIGSGTAITIQNLAHTIAKITGFGGAIKNDTSKSDGTMHKALDISKLTAMGWTANHELEAGLKTAYEDFIQNHL